MQKKDAGDVHLKLTAPIPFVDAQHRFGMKYARGIDQDMKLPEGVARRLDHVGGLKAVGDIGLQRYGRAAARVDFSSQARSARSILMSLTATDAPLRREPAQSLAHARRRRR